jgi:hypothetical protein
MAKKFKTRKIHSFSTKYHIGDKFKYGKITGVITQISDRFEQYSLSFINSKTYEQIAVSGLKSAWWTRDELDNFKYVVKEIWEDIYDAYEEYDEMY